MNHASLSTRLLKTNSYPKSCNTIQFNCALIKRINHLRDIIREGGLWSITINNAFCCLCLLIANQHPAGNIYFCLSTCLISFATFSLVYLLNFLPHVYLISPCLSDYLLLQLSSCPSSCHMFIWYLLVSPSISLPTGLLLSLILFPGNHSLIPLSPCPSAYILTIL